MQSAAKVADKTDRQLAMAQNSSATRNSISTLSRSKIPPAFTRRKRPREFLASPSIFPGRGRSCCATAKRKQNPHRRNCDVLSNETNDENDQNHRRRQRIVLFRACRIGPRSNTLLDSVSAINISMAGRSPAARLHRAIAAISFSAAPPHRKRHASVSQFYSSSRRWRAVAGQ